MRLWRITNRKYALDKLCTGAALYGGRWNPVGMPALYCGASIAITALEKLTHLGTQSRPPLVLVAVDIPDDAITYDPGLAVLPRDWDELPTSAAAQAFGGAWLTRGGELTLKVPSAIVHEESNVIVNPRHRDYYRVTLTVLRPFSFDLRLIK